ncbi:MAG: hypothetical protein K6C08_14370 [Oscillospiraceae bacterium]|nr:hypothetical protein [Oscillospiraceae bacterium]
MKSALFERSFLLTGWYCFRKHGILSLLSEIIVLKDVWVITNEQNHEYSKNEIDGVWSVRMFSDHPYWTAFLFLLFWHNPNGWFEYLLCIILSSVCSDAET